MSPSSSPEDSSLKPVRPGRGLLLTGVAAAALMGMGLGLWARPAMSERQMALPVVAAARPAETRMLQIVLDDTPAPLGAPIELLPRSSEPPRPAPPERAPQEFLAPVRPSAGLVRVQSIEPEPVEAAPKAEPPPAPRKLAAPKPVKVKAVVAPKRAPKLEKAKVVEKARATPPATRSAKADPKPARTGVRLAKVDRPPKAERIEKVAVKRPAKPNAAAQRIAQHKAAPKPTRAQKVKLETRTRKATRPALKVAQQARPAKAAAPKVVKPVKGAGPLRVAKAQPRPDTAIRDADRRMSRAYSSARAAGVPDWQLRKQQARWEAARASAAREAPWAVHDVYLARIAELHDLTKDAQASGY
jgi:hypothetical protein